MHRFLLVFLLSCGFWGALSATPDSLSVYNVAMRDEVNKSSWHLLRQAFSEAREVEADLIMLSINTYGGAVDMADSMRTLILNSSIPVWAFIDNQAASAGALIALACDSIYMREGGSIGAATVVVATGEEAPDKYQSFMRSMMRSTAQAKGKHWVRQADGDSVEVFRRSPELAESMVDPSVAIPGVIDSGHVLTLTSHEAVALGLCEGVCESVEEILQRYGIVPQSVAVYEAKPIDRVKSFMVNPIVSGLLIMLIVGGLYFELQTPGVGFPLVVAILAAVAYFLPLYVDGLVQYLDVILFLAGIILLLVEIFAIPGFGVTGVLGIVCVTAGLSLALVDNEFIFRWEPGAGASLAMAVAIVMGSFTLSVIASIALSGALISSPRVPALALRKNLDTQEGYVGVSITDNGLVGQRGVASTVLRPSGKVLIADSTYDAVSVGGMIEKGRTVEVMRIETNQIYVREVEA